VSPVLKVDQLGITHVRGHDRRLALVRDVSLELRPGEILGLVGESGSGKSLTARAVMGILPRALQAHGSILFDGEDVSRLAGPERRRLLSHGMGMIFQDPRAAINPVQRIDRFLMEALRFHDRTDARERGALRRRVMAALESTGIRDPSGWPTAIRTSSRAACSSGR
jgi:peptide/nickel transport system ATP-binding protein